MVIQPEGLTPYNPFLIFLQTFTFYKNHKMQKASKNKYK